MHEEEDLPLLSLYGNKRNDVPPIDPDIAAHISTLAIPVIPRSKDMVAMLQIHDLGRFGQDPVLLDLINDIFDSQRHTYVVLYMHIVRRSLIQIPLAAF